MRENRSNTGLYDTLKLQATGSPSEITQSRKASPKSEKQESDGIVKSKRRHAPKVRTGCLTCKKRRVKCDEAKPHCKRCLTSRTTCDGYAKPSPPKAPRPLVQRELSSASTLTAAPFSRVHCRNDVELHYFQIYKSELTSIIGGSFPTKVWDVIILQASQDEQFVLSLILAISAAYCAKRALQQGNNAAADEHGDHAIKQYQRGLQEINIASNGPESNPRKSLISFLLVSCFEALSGNVLSCLAQSQNGHDLLQSWLGATPYPNASRVGISSPAPHVIEHDLIQAAFFFDTQLLQHYDSRNMELHRLLKYEGEETIERMPHNFTDVDEAKAYWMLVQRRASHFVWEASGLGNEGSTYAESSSTITTGGSPGMTNAPNPYNSESRSRSTSVPNYTAPPSHFLDVTQTPRSNSITSVFNDQDASQQLFELSHFTSGQTVDYLSTTTIQHQDVLFDPSFDFLSPPLPPSKNPLSESSTPRLIPTTVPSSFPIPPPAPIVDILAMHKKYSNENLRWRLSFSHLYSRLKKSSNPSLIIAANILFIQSIATEVQLSTVLSLPAQPHRNSTASSRHEPFSNPTSQPVAQSPLNDYREIVTTSRAVIEAIKKQETEAGGAPRVFVFELGVSQALYIVYQHCPDVVLRNEALELLRWYGCREGAWDCLGLIEGGGEFGSLQIGA